MKLKLLLYTFMTLVITSCGDKEETAPECETNRTATITVSNTLSDPYDMFINDVYSTTISAKGILRDYSIREGNGTRILFRQKSGFLLFPTEYEVNENIVRCSNYTRTLP